MPRGTETANYAVFVKLPSKCFFALVRSILPLQQEVNVSFTQEHGLTIDAIDTTNCACINAQIAPTDFEQFHITVDSTLGWDLRTVAKNVKPIADSIIIAYDPEHENDVEFTQSTNAGLVESCFRMKLLSIEVDTLKVPPADDDDMDLIASFASSMLCPTSPIGRLMDISAGVVSIEYNDSELVFAVESSTGSGKIVLSKAAADPKNCVLAGAATGVRMVFATAFMSRFFQASGIGERIIIRMQKDNPIRIEFPFLKSAALHFVLAPRIDEDTPPSAMES